MFKLRRIYKFQSYKTFNIFCNNLLSRLGKVIMRKWVLAFFLLHNRKKIEILAFEAIKSKLNYNRHSMLTLIF